jgi:glutathione S-transferase
VLKKKNCNFSLKLGKIEAMSAAPKSVTLAYWTIRGLAAPIRLLAAHCGVPLVNKLYEPGQAGTPEYKKSWMDVKFTLGLDFPNLPYLIEE